MPMRCNINNMARKPNKPRLQLVKPEPQEPAGEGAPPRVSRRSPRLANGLTMKQEAFCRAISEGDAPAAAYRKAFDAGEMKTATIYARASELAARSNIRARIDELIAEREREALHDARRAREWSLKLLREIAEAGQTEGARLGAIQTVMKHHALLTDRVEQETTDARTVDELRQELADALALLANPPRMRA